MEDVKVREMQIFDFKKKIAEAETKLKQQQNLYEAVRSDRNLYSKNLIESQVTFYFISLLTYILSLPVEHRPQTPSNSVSCYRLHHSPFVAEACCPYLFLRIFFHVYSGRLCGFKVSTMMLVWQCCCPLFSTC